MPMGFVKKEKMEFSQFSGIFGMEFLVAIGKIGIRLKFLEFLELNWIGGIELAFLELNWKSHKSERLFFGQHIL